MLAAVRGTASLFVDRATQQWVVRDPDGNFWILPSVNDPWENRQPYELEESQVLESVPRHYLYLLRLPF